MSDGNSLFDRIRRTLRGPTPAERAEAYVERARESPETFDADDGDAIVDLLADGDEDVVGDALEALGALVDDRPDLCSAAVPALVSDLSRRPREEWVGTSLGEASQSFLYDLRRGSILLSLGRANPDYLDPVVDDIAAALTAEGDNPDPLTEFALAHVAAADPDRVDVPTAYFVNLVADELVAGVDPDADPDGMPITGTEDKIGLLAEFGGDTARDALTYARDTSDDDAVVDAATDAIGRLSADA